MEHTFLFWHATDEELETHYPEGVVDDVDPGVGFALNNGDDCTVFYNNKLTNYEVTVHLEDRSGTTLASGFTVESRDVLSGNSVIVYVYAPEISGYKPASERKKLNISGNSECTIQYIGETSYTVTVHHVCEGSAITADTEVVSETVWEDEFATVTIEPEEVENYVAESVTIRVSGDCEYTLEYREVTGPETVDLGLPSGTLWAAWNVGAGSPEEIGDYYAWGETETKNSYTLANYLLFDTGTSAYTKYNETDEKNNLDNEDDVVAVTYGGEWHMPTQAQIQELTGNTESALTTYNGVSGCQFTSSVNGNTIFFPYAIVYGENCQDATADVDISHAFIWSNGLNGTSMATIFDIFGDGLETYSAGRHYGLPVRGVIGVLENSGGFIPIDPGGDSK